MIIGRLAFASCIITLVGKIGSRVSFSFYRVRSLSKSILSLREVFLRVKTI